MDIETAGAELYGMPLGEFTARRTALSREAKASGDKELAKAIAGLRKPTTSAWVVNMLARHRADRVDEIAALGEELRDAQDALDAPRLRELGKQRSALVRQVTREAVAVAEGLGTEASAAVSGEVAQTLQTAMIDADAAALVASGTLVKPLTAAGWGIEEGGDVIAFPTATQRAGRRAAVADAPAKSGGSAGSKKARPDAPTRSSAQERKRGAERKQAELDLATAEAALAKARDEAEELRASAEAVSERRASLRDEVEELTRQLREAEGELADAEGEARGIRRSRDEAKRAVTAAERAVARARRRLD
ncbi:hypothetical protein FVA74_00495 [Salinibacterium sp. dk2585]|uniref:hypothetical protein n=1 Tax=unclassified Salinibacterium TaxID=2632331 RepID=UPI0011C246FB|nr:MULTISPECIES: hypothetical protein [unclassified Salinibacterium]QEE60206.1 hypothetical protein FVA74_00495 [Salinibacterium sp. dk2585]TXK55278.1 hypothetical protein FVP63_00640 [Salinibacterium sp. dk5596]